MNDMVPSEGQSAINIPDEFMRKAEYIKHKLDKDRNLLINDVTGEEKTQLLVRIVNVKMERLYMEEGELICASRDSKFSKDGVQCETCANVYNTPFIDKEEQEARYKKACIEQNIQNAPAWNRKTLCKPRLVVQWQEEFEKNADGFYIWIKHPGICYLSCPPSSLAAMTFRQTGYLARLKSKGYNDITKVITVISVGQRRNEQIKTTYSYETFDMENTYEAVLKKCVNYAEMVATQGEPLLESAPPAQEVTHTTPAEKSAQGSASAQIAPKTAPASKSAPAKTAKTTPAKTTPAKTAPAEKPATPPVTEPVTTSVQTESGTPAQERMKIKFVFATLPADVKGIILNVLKVDAIDKVADVDLKVAFETLELAKQEVANRGPVAESEQPAQNTGQSSAGDQKKTTPW